MRTNQEHIRECQQLLNEPITDDWIVRAEHLCKRAHMQDQINSLEAEVNNRSVNLFVSKLTKGLEKQEFVKPEFQEAFWARAEEV